VKDLIDENMLQLQEGSLGFGVGEGEQRVVQNDPGGLGDIGFSSIRVLTSI
jgi:hypothetical protein